MYCSPVRPHLFLRTLRKFWTLREAAKETMQSFVFLNMPLMETMQSFVFLNMSLWALLEQTERAILWKMQQNVHIEHCSQVSRLHRSSLLPIVRAFWCYTAFLSAISVIQLWAKGTSILFWHPLIQPLCLQDRWHTLICLRETGLKSGNKFFRGSPNISYLFRGEPIIGGPN